MKRFLHIVPLFPAALLAASAFAGGALHPIEEPVTNMSWLVGGVWTPDEMAAGYALAATGTTSAADFDPPDGALRVARWTRRGYCHSFMPVESHLPRLAAGVNGALFTARDGVKAIPHRYSYSNDLVVAPLFAPNWLGLVHGLGDFWYATNSLASRYVWKDMAFNRSTNTLVSFATTLFRSGEILIEYGDTCTNEAQSVIQVGTNTMWLGDNRAGRSFLYKSIKGLGSGNDDTDEDGLSDYAEISAYWTDPQDPDTDHDGLSDGDEVETSHTDPRRFDSDRDGLVDSIDPQPLVSDGNCHGQSDAWIAATFTNAAEILSVGYTNWVDGIVGDNDTNGVAKLTLCLPSFDHGPVVISFDGMRVVANEEGEYVFPVYSCRERTLSLSRAISNATVTLQVSTSSDPIVPAPLLRSSGAPSSTWEYAHGETFLEEIVPFRVWTMYMPHRIVVSPDTWSPAPTSGNEEAVTFQAIPFGVPPGAEVTCEWSASNPRVFSIVPSGSSARVTCRWDEGEWGAGTIRVVSTCCSSIVTGELAVAYGEIPEFGANVCATARPDREQCVSFEVPAGMRSYIALYAATQEDSFRAAEGFNDALFWRISAPGFQMVEGSASSSMILPGQEAAIAEGRSLDGFAGVVFSGGGAYTAPGNTSLVVTVWMNAADGRDDKRPSYLIAKEYSLVVTQENMPEAGGVADTTDVGGPEATYEQRLPTNGVAYVTGEPAAADLSAEFMDMPDWHQVIWSGRLTSERLDRHGIDNRVLLASTGTVYDISAALTNEVIGGRLALAATLDGNELPEYPFSIRGKNPLDATARAYIDANVDAEFADYAWMIAKHESKTGETRYYNQFNPSEGSHKGRPFKGNGTATNPNWGWGIGQIDGEFMESSVVWDWHENVQRISAVLASKRQTYFNHISYFRASYGNNGNWTEPPSIEIEGVHLTAENWAVLIYYNGVQGVVGRETPTHRRLFYPAVSFDPETGVWSFNRNTRNPTYVEDVLRDSTREGED